MIPAGEIEYWASLGNLAKVMQALGEGHDVNQKGEGGYTPLHAAAENGNVAVALLLLDRGADPNSKLEDGRTALDLAELAGEHEASRLLRERTGHGKPE